MKTVVFSNHKGGVGKSVLGVHQAFFLSDQGKKVLFIDLDPQGNSSKTLSNFDTGIEAFEMFGEQFRFPDTEPESGTISLIRASRKLTDLDSKPLQDVVGSFIRSLKIVAEKFDVCVIDTPPTFGVRMTAALMGATHVVAPIEMEEYSIDGIVELLSLIRQIRSRFNQNLQMVGMLVNRLDRRSAEQRAALAEIQRDHGKLLIPAQIGLRTAIPRAITQKQPVWSLKTTAARSAAREMNAALSYIHEKMGV